MYTIEEKRAQRVAYMRRYREKNRERLKPVRRAEGQRYWRENKEKIIAKRRLKPRPERDSEKYLVYAKTYREKHPERIKDSQKKYNTKNPNRGMGRQRRMQEAAAGRPRPDHCEICGASDTPGLKGNGRIAFDHCHKTGAFRGWICSHCNKALGFAKDDPNILRKMIAYLE